MTVAQPEVPSTYDPAVVHMALDNIAMMTTLMKGGPIGIEHNHNTGEFTVKYMVMGGIRYVTKKTLHEALNEAVGIVKKEMGWR